MPNVRIFYFLLPLQFLELTPTLLTCCGFLCISAAGSLEFTQRKLQRMIKRYPLDEKDVQ